MADKGEKPQPLLDARIHRALGNKIIFDDELRPSRWVGVLHHLPDVEGKKAEDTYHSIPAYSTEDGLAVKALKEYCKGKEWAFTVYGNRDSNKYTVLIGTPRSGIVSAEGRADVLAQAVCLSIVAHAESRGRSER